MIQNLKSFYAWIPCVEPKLELINENRVRALDRIYPKCETLRADWVPVRGKNGKFMKYESFPASLPGYPAYLCERKA